MNLFSVSFWLGCRAILIVGLTASLPLAAQIYTASPISAGSYGTYPYSVTGMLFTPKGQGSGAVVANPRVVFSCAHVVFDKTALDPWVSGVRWHRAWSSSSPPFAGTGQLLRGYYHYLGYATAALDKVNSSRSFSQDFVVHYAFENTANGGYAGYYDDGASQLKANTEKLITGYPSGLYGSVDAHKYLMHQTGPFTRAFSANLDDYLEVTEVSAGPGNSGGPVWVNYQGEYYFVGVEISGFHRSLGDSTDSMGVYGVDSSSRELINNAVRASGATVAAPTITTQPTSRRVNAGDYAIFTVVASGSLLSYQWLFNGILISGATDSALTLTNVRPASAGTYQVVVSNTGGETRSTVVTLSVDSVPTIVNQPASQAVVAGFNATLSISIESSIPATYQWRKDGVPVSGATNATLVLNNVQSNTAGTYVVVVTNSLGSVSSASATITVIPSARLANLSVRTMMASSQTLIVGVVVNGGARNILVRAAGPALAGFGLTSAMNDPQLELYNGTAKIFENQDWPATLVSTFASVGAFSFSNGSRDAAFVQNIDGARSIWARGTGPGVVLVEAYDTGASTAARLVNVSARNRVGTGDDILIAGFNIAGTGTKRLLIRAVGPKLSTFGVTGFLVDPKLEIYSSAGSRLMEDDNWSPILAATFSAVGAFALDAGSRDAALLAILTPGSYTVQVRGADGGTGEALIEIYEVP
jgi:hypothetical protein